VERDRRQGDHVGDEGGCHQCQVGECIVSVPGVHVLVRRTVPSEVEEEVRFVDDLLLGKARSPKRGEGGDDLQEASRCWVDFWGGTDKPKACEAPLVADQAGERGDPCLSVETDRVGGRKTIGSPPTDPSPEDSHRVKNRGGR